MDDPNREVSEVNEELPLGVLFYRYFWPFWLFRDVSRGGMYAQAAAYRHNCEMSVHLPTYLKRWSALCALALGALFACSPAATEPQDSFYVLLTAGAGVAFTCCFAIACIIASIYARLHFE